jgi:hypothetical protein
VFLAATVLDEVVLEDDEDGNLEEDGELLAELETAACPRPVVHSSVYTQSIYKFIVCHTKS